MDTVPLSVRGSYIVIPLTHGQYALIDLDCWPVVGRHKWHPKRDKQRWYAETALGRGVKLHQLIMGLRRGWDIDHENRNGLDDRRQNLRWATRPQNAANCRSRRSNTGYRGAYFDKNEGRFVAKIMHEGRLRTLGRFSNAEDAARAYDRAARATYGEFAQTNFPENTNEQSRSVTG